MLNLTGVTFFVLCRPWKRSPFCHIVVIFINVRRLRELVLCSASAGECWCGSRPFCSLQLRGNASSSELSLLTLIVLHRPRGLFWHQSDLSSKKRGMKDRQGHIQTLGLEISLRSVKPTWTLKMQSVFLDVSRKWRRVSVEDQGGELHPLSLKETPRMDERETQGGGMLVAYIHTFAYFFFQRGRCSFYRE